MNQRIMWVWVVLGFSLSAMGALSKEVKLDSQGEYERDLQAVVRNKMYYKAGRFEAAGNVGVMPYDSIVNHFMVGGKLTWHLSDHYGWEVIDAMVSFPSVTGYAQDLVKSQGISNLQATKLKFMGTTNFLVSPFYGKIRFFGSQLLFFDIYLVAGGGLANTESIRISSTAVGATATETSLSTGMAPVFDFGLGFKIFLNPAMGLVIDLRDYLVFAETYGSRSPKSNFTVFAGLNFFLPSF